MPKLCSVLRVGTNYEVQKPLQVVSMAWLKYRFPKLRTAGAVLLASIRKLVLELCAVKKSLLFQACGASAKGTLSPSVSQWWVPGAGPWGDCFYSSVEIVLAASKCCSFLVYHVRCRIWSFSSNKWRMCSLIGNVAKALCLFPLYDSEGCQRSWHVVCVSKYKRINWGSAVLRILNM